MTLNDYQLQASVFAPDDDSDLRLAINALGLAGEAGEVADEIKKHLGYQRPIDEGKLLLELGDVLWYLSEIARAHGFTLQQVARANISKLTARYPNGYSHAAGVARADLGGK